MNHCRDAKHAKSSCKKNFVAESRNEAKQAAQKLTSDNLELSLQLKI